MTSAHTRREVRRDTATGRPRRTTGASIVLGIGLGGFVDGILLHQLLQWHHMLTSTDSDNVGIQYYPRETVHGLQLNTMWDDCSMLSPGSWCSPAWRCCTRASSTPGAGCGPPECCGGWVLVGWGLFNIVEGVVDQRPGDPPRAQRATPTRLGS